jgi:photosystem II stability/assembly factor-like uncharacterized protein
MRPRSNLLRALAIVCLPLMVLRADLSAQDVPHWQIVHDSISYLRIAAADTRHFAAVSFQPRTVVVSSDAGVTWQRVFDMPAYSDSFALREIAHPAPGLVLVLADSMYFREFANFQNQYDHTTIVMRSTDGGGTWEQIPVGTPRRRHQSLAIVMTDPMTGYILQRDTLPVVLRTTDGGRTWQQIAPPAGMRFAQSLTAHRGSVFLRSWDHVARSSDDGASWEVVATDLPKSPHAIIAVSPTTLYAAGLRQIVADRFAGRLFRSTDGGARWQAVLDTLTTGNGFTTVAFADSTNGVVTGGAGMFRTRDGGATWTQERLPQTGTSGVSTGLVTVAAGTVAMPSSDTLVAAGFPSVILRHVVARQIARPVITIPEKDDTVDVAALAIRWNSIDGAVAYHVRVVERDTVTFPPGPLWDPNGVRRLDTTITDTAIVLSPTRRGKEYQIRVRAIADGVGSPWTATRFAFVVERPTASVASDAGSRTAPQRSALVRSRTKDPHLSLPLAPLVGFVVVDVAGRHVASGAAGGDGTARIEIASLAPGAYVIATTDASVSLRLLVTP